MAQQLQSRESAKTLCPKLGRPKHQPQSDRKTNIGLKNLRTE